VPAAGPQAVAPTPARLEAYAGLYREPATEGLLRLYVKDGVLMGSPGAGADGGWAVTPIDARRFSIPTTPIVLEFVPATSRTPMRLRITGERPAPDVLDRLEPFTASPAALAACAGTYVSPELDTSYTVTPTRHGLSLAIPGRAALDLTPILADRFSGPLVGVIRFVRRPGGGVAGFTLNTNGARGLRFARAASPKAMGTDPGAK